MTAVSAAPAPASAAPNTQAHAYPVAAGSTAGRQR